MIARTKASPNRKGGPAKAASFENTSNGSNGKVVVAPAGRRKGSGSGAHHRPRPAPAQIRAAAALYAPRRPR